MSQRKTEHSATRKNRRRQGTAKGLGEGGRKVYNRGDPKRGKGKGQFAKMGGLSLNDPDSVKRWWERYSHSEDGKVGSLNQNMPLKVTNKRRGRGSNAREGKGPSALKRKRVS